MKNTSNKSKKKSQAQSLPQYNIGILSIIVGALILVGVLFVLLTRAAAPAVPAGYKEVFLDDFSGTTLDKTKWSVTTGTEGNSQANYTANNVSVSNGTAVLRSRRHCVPTGTSPALDDTNASTAPCAAGMDTKYSSGQIRTGNVFPSEGRIEIRAKLPAAQKGAWPALWTRNQSGWCTANYGELDLMEWYFDGISGGSTFSSVNNNTSTTHMTCANNATKKVQHNVNTGSDLTAAYHTWAMDYGPSGVQYYLDGVLQPSASGQGDSDKTIDSFGDFSGLTQDQFNLIMNQLWQIRINTQIIKAGDAWHNPPDNTQAWQDIYYQIDYVRVMVKDASTTTIVPSTPPPTTTITPTPTDTGTPVPTTTITPTPTTTTTVTPTTTTTVKPVTNPASKKK